MTLSEVLARLKHAIDQSNHRRIKMIDEIDNEVSSSLLELRQETPEARLHWFSWQYYRPSLNSGIKAFPRVSRRLETDQMGKTVWPSC